MHKIEELPAYIALFESVSFYTILPTLFFRVFPRCLRRFLRTLFLLFSCSAGEIHFSADIVQVVPGVCELQAPDSGGLQVFGKSRGLKTSRALCLL